jgi:hypothetical protein
MKKKLLYILLLLISFCVISYYFIANSGYAFNETKALNEAYPYREGKVVYQKEFGNNKIVIWNSNERKYAKVVHTKWGILYRVISISEILPKEPNDYISRSWSASSISQDLYKSAFAFEVNNPAIEKILISNENIDDVISRNLAEIKKISAVYIELKVENGYSVSYNELSALDTGHFLFRGLDKDGKILAVGR